MKCHSRLLFFLLTFLGSFTISAQAPYTFEHITTFDGLSHGNVHEIIQDSRGFMWFGTEDGLNKFDGYTFTVYKNSDTDTTSIRNNSIKDILEYKETLWIGTYGGGLAAYDRNKDVFRHYYHNPNDPNSLSHNLIEKLFVDSKGVFWVGTWGGGVNIFDPQTGTFKSYRHDDKVPGSLSSDFVNDIEEDKWGNIWIATEKGGVNKFDEKTKKFISYRHSDDPNSISSTYVRSLLCDSNGNLWLGTQNGFCKYREQSNDFVVYQHDPEDPNSLSNNIARKLIEDKNGHIWIGTENGGISIFNPEDKSFKHIYHDANYPKGLNNNSIYSFFLDDVGAMWIGTYSGGVNYYNKKSRKFELVNSKMSRNSLSNNNVLAFLEDSESDMWICTDGGGLNKIDKETGEFSHYRNKADDPGSISGDHVLSIIEDKPGTFWVGTWSDGLNKFDKESGTFKHYKHDPEDSLSIATNNVWHMIIDSQNRLWMSVFYGGVNRYQRKSDNFIRYLHDPNDPNSLNINNIHHLYEDQYQKIWVGSAGEGLSVYDPSIDGFKHYVHNTTDSNSISDNNINYMMEDSKGNYWIGTKIGLNLFDREKEEFRAYREEDGLPNDVIQGILEDDNGNLWISTNKGISKFDPVKETFKNFGIEDGLQGNDFFHGSCYKTRDGKMYFGGPNGYNTFHPDSIKDNREIPPVVLTGFTVFNKPVKIGGKSSFLNKHITEADEITLSYEHYVFSFEFSALNYVGTEKNQYAYMLEGFDKEWNYVGTNRSATYTNIDPGKYVFRVKGSNNDGYWNEEGASVIVNITPPFWETWWFRMLLIVLGIGIFVGVVWLRTRMVNQQKIKLEREVKSRTLEIRQKNRILAQQTKDLKIANKEIKDSIKAAEVIQKSILPPANYVEELFQESFILYLPRDVVSGDFYWIEEIEGKKYIAVVDCAGHGVSGAFMSINGHHLLNKVVREHKINSAATILGRLNEEVIKEFQNRQESLDLAEGMDIALCVMDRQNSALGFSGANLPLYLLRDGELIQYKGHNGAIGAVFDDSNDDPFEEHSVKLQKGDVIYLFSDGYADQIGGEQGVDKFLYPRFRDLLVEISHLEMEKQKQILNEELNSWKGEHEQIDDILIIGIRI